MFCLFDGEIVCGGRSSVVYDTVCTVKHFLFVCGLLFGGVGVLYLLLLLFVCLFVVVDVGGGGGGGGGGGVFCLLLLLFFVCCC